MMLVVYMYINFLLFCCMNKVVMVFEIEKMLLWDNILEKIYVMEFSDLYFMILNILVRKYEILCVRKIFDVYMFLYCILDIFECLLYFILEVNDFVLMVFCDVDGFYIWFFELFWVMVNDMLKFIEIDVGFFLLCRGNGIVNLLWFMRVNNL